MIAALFTRRGHADTEAREGDLMDLMCLRASEARGDESGLE